MIHEIVRQKLRGEMGLTVGEIAQRTGYHYPYACELLNGTQPFSDSARLRFARAFPETASILLPDLAPIADEPAEAQPCPAQ